MEKKLFNGVGVAIVTPFDSEGNVDIKSLKNLVQHIIDNRADFITVLGTTAESVTLTLEERELVVKVVAEQNDGRLPLLLGVGGNCTAAVINDLQTLPYIKYCQGILSVVPYYNKPSQQGIYEHFKAIAQVSPLPIVLYNVPGRTGLNLTADTALKLSKIENIVAVKEASGNFSQIAEIASKCGDDLYIYSGNDDQTVPMLALGAKGVISVSANIIPKDTHDMVKSFMDGDVAKSRELQLKAIELISALFIEVNPIPVKEAANLIGFNAGGCRLPLTSMGDKNREILSNAIKAYMN